ncbi:hypothetical protein BESB_073010 [Besnoitia besnoiti]|uniref:Uncharacterized protein n=1 Tax=Besnoitia besnoiti TaxID=94643 RepID=A0A2A9M8A1_BESBE|nr:uncharacterized protein BESB_073010 [Besnoitia besnoiti]PFH34149.1 hypothetical protein BESB_073010 [Besnoitia besnoiti]
MRTLQPLAPAQAAGPPKGVPCLSSAELAILSSLLVGVAPPHTPDAQRCFEDDEKVPLKPAAQHRKSSPDTLRPESGLKLEVASLPLQGTQKEAGEAARPKTPELRNTLAGDGCSTTSSCVGLRRDSDVKSAARGTEVSGTDTAKKREKKSVPDLQDFEERADGTLLDSHLQRRSPDEKTRGQPRDLEGLDSSLTAAAETTLMRIETAAAAPYGRKAGGTDSASIAENLEASSAVASERSAPCKSGEQQALVDLLMQFVKQHQAETPGTDGRQETAERRGGGAASPETAAANRSLSALQAATGAAAVDRNKGAADIFSLLAAAAENAGGQVPGHLNLFGAFGGPDRRGAEVTVSRGLGRLDEGLFDSDVDSWKSSAGRSARESIAGALGLARSRRLSGSETDSVHREREGAYDSSPHAQRPVRREAGAAPAENATDTAARGLERDLLDASRLTAEAVGLDFHALNELLFSSGALEELERSGGSLEALFKDLPPQGPALGLGPGARTAVAAASSDRLSGWQHVLSKEEAGEGEAEGVRPPRTSYGQQHMQPSSQMYEEYLVQNANLRRARGHEAEGPSRLSEAAQEGPPARSWDDALFGDAERSAGADGQEVVQREPGPFEGRGTASSPALAKGEEEELLKRMCNLGRARTQSGAPALEQGEAWSTCGSDAAQLQETGGVQAFALGAAGEETSRAARHRGRSRAAAGAAPSRGPGGTGFQAHTGDETGSWRADDADDDGSLGGLASSRHESGRGAVLDTHFQDSSAGWPSPASFHDLEAERERQRSSARNGGSTRGGGESATSRGSQDRRDLPPVPPAGVEPDALGAEAEEEAGSSGMIMAEDEPLTDQQVALLNHIYEVLSKAEEYFSFKSALYQLHIKRHLKSCVCASSRGGHAHNSTKAIRLFPFMPTVPINGVEQRALLNVRKRLQAGSSSVLVPGGLGQHVIEELDELLTSLINKLLLIIVVKYQTCFIHAPARAQLREFLVSFVFPGDAATQLLFRDHVQAVVHARIRHFRDSVGRTLRQHQPMSRGRRGLGGSGWAGAGEVALGRGASGASAESGFAAKRVGSPEMPVHGLPAPVGGRAGGRVQRDRGEEEAEERGKRRKAFGATAAEYLRAAATATQTNAAAGVCAGRGRLPQGELAEGFLRRGPEDAKQEPSDLGSMATVDDSSGMLARLRLESHYGHDISEGAPLWKAGRQGNRHPPALEEGRVGGALLPDNPAGGRRGCRTGEGEGGSRALDWHCGLPDALEKASRATDRTTSTGASVGDWGKWRGDVSDLCPGDRRS